MDSELILRGVSLAKETACDLGDPRRSARVQGAAAAVALDPTRSFPKLFPTEAEREGFYRLVNSPFVSLPKVIAAHHEATVRRAEELGEILAVHDTTEFAFPAHDDHVREHLCPLSKTRQGFYGHVTLAVSNDSLRAPLGVLGFFGFVHRQQVSAETASYWTEQFGDYDKESKRWVMAFAAAQKRIGDRAWVIHVCDREADTNEVLESLHSNNWRYVIRAFQDRVTTDGVRVGDVARRGALSIERKIEISHRASGNRPPKSRKTFPERRAREAKIVIRAQGASLPIGSGSIETNVVEVIELDPPEGEEPIHWILLTKESVQDEQSLERVVDIYRSRWMIEEYFKAIKTGCAYEERQLDSAASLLVALGITLVVAWQLLVLRHLSRHPEAKKRPASTIMAPVMLALLKAATAKSIKWPEEPTIFDAMCGVARLGGHIKSNGSPGWQVLGRGFEKLLAIRDAVDVALAAGLVINP